MYKEVIIMTPLVFTPRNFYKENKIFDSTCLDLAFAKANMMCRTDKFSIFCKLFDSDIYNRDTISDSPLTNRLIPV